MKPIIFFDTETTGVDIVNDRIISICAIKVSDLDTLREIARLGRFMNPGIPIPASATEVHGITNEAVKDSPKFTQNAEELFRFFSGCDLAGFNLTNFDVPLLWEEFYRAGITWDLTGVNIIDVGTIFKKKEPRTLSTAVMHYCERNHDGAHDAMADTQATMDVFAAQMFRYQDVGNMNVEELHKFSVREPRLDLAGKIIIDKDGDPVYAFGKSKGVKLKHDPGFANWMLAKDFPSQTKIVIKKYLDSIDDIPFKFAK